MTAYTPGPWSVGQTREVHGYPTKAVETLVCVGEGATQGNAIARVGLGGPGATRYTAESVEANARLIAAAPELFNACQEMLNEIRAYQGESEFEEGSIVKDWCDMLKAAISKATQGTP